MTIDDYRERGESLVELEHLGQKQVGFTIEHRNDRPACWKGPWRVQLHASKNRIAFQLTGYGATFIDAVNHLRRQLPVNEPAYLASIEPDHVISDAEPEPLPPRQCCQPKDGVSHSTGLPSKRRRCPSIAADGYTICPAHLELWARSWPQPRIDSHFRVRA